MVKVDLGIKFNHTEIYKIFDFLLWSYDASQISLDLRSHEYIIFDTEELSYDADEEEE